MSACTSPGNPSTGDARLSEADKPALQELPGLTPGAGTSWRTVSRKGLLAIVLLCLLLVALTAAGIHRFSGGASAAADAPVRERPAAASGGTRRLDTAGAPASAARAALPQVPALAPTEDGPLEPIAVRRVAAGADRGSQAMDPQDAPVLLVSSRPSPGTQDAALQAPGPALAESDAQDPLAATTRNLQAYQHHLQGMLQRLARSADRPDGATVAMPVAAVPAAGPAPASGGLFGGQLRGSSTAGAAARPLGNPSLTLPKGTTFGCALKTRVVSATSGLMGCQVQRHVYSADGRVLLVERGSHVDGEYRMTSIRPGTVRIPVLWTRLRTPLGVVVDLESPATGPLGESGIEGHVDNRWGERLGAAMLLSLIDDAVKLVVQDQGPDRQGSTVVLPATTSSTSKLAEKVLDSTINLPPLIYRHQGGIVGIHVARDIDFSSVYALAPTAMPPQED